MISLSMFATCKLTVKAIEKHQVGDRISLVVLRRVEPITTTTDNNVAINKFEAVILSLVLSSKDSIQIN